MGMSWSSRRRNNAYYQNPHQPSQLISSSSYPYHSEPYHGPSPHPYHGHPPPPPPPPHPGYPPLPPAPIYSSYYYSGSYTARNYANPAMDRTNFVPYYSHQPNGWTGMRPPLVVGPPAPPPPQYVDHQQAKKVRNDVNVHKDSLRLEVDEWNPDHYLVSFVFDALFDGR